MSTTPEPEWPPVVSSTEPSGVTTAVKAHRGPGREFGARLHVNPSEEVYTVARIAPVERAPPKSHSLPWNTAKPIQYRPGKGEAECATASTQVAPSEL